MEEEVNKSDDENEKMHRLEKHRLTAQSSVNESVISKFDLGEINLKTRKTSGILLAVSIFLVSVGLAAVISKYYYADENLKTVEQQYIISKGAFDSLVMIIKDSNKEIQKENLAIKTTMKLLSFKTSLSGVDSLLTDTLLNYFGDTNILKKEVTKDWFNIPGPKRKHTYGYFSGENILVQLHSDSTIETHTTVSKSFEEINKISDVYILKMTKDFKIYFVQRLSPEYH